ncbi:MAG: SecY family transport protein, partial [Clostridia bacterium]
ISNLFTGIASMVSEAVASPSLTPWLTLLAVIAAALLMTLVITFVDMGVRRINVHFAKRVTGRKMYGGQNSVIPLKVVSVGVLPLIFAYSFMAFPSTIIQLVGGGESGIAMWWAQYMGSTSPLYLLVTALLIVAFTYFYTSISFQPDEMSKNIQQQGGAIPSVRPGKPTADYLKRINNRLTLFAALFLAVLATFPNLLTVGLNARIPFAASSLLIAVSVVLETKRQLDDLLVSRNYDTIS